MIKKINIYGKEIEIDDSKKTVVVVQTDIMAIRAIKTGFVLKDRFNVIGVCQKSPKVYYKGWGEGYFPILEDANLTKSFSEILKSTKIDCIYYHNPGEWSFIPVYESFLKNLNIPLIYDINDSISWNILYAPTEAHKNKKIRESLLSLEDRAINYSCGIVTPGIQLTEYLSNKHKDKKINTFTNYFCDFGSIKPSKVKHSDRDKNIHVACYGSISANNKSGVYYYEEVFRQLLKNNNVIIHILPSTYDNLNYWKSLSKNIIISDRKDPISSATDLSMCDLGLNIFNPRIWGTDLCKYSSPNKTFDCIALGLPILAHSSTPNIFDFVSKYDVGFGYTSKYINGIDFRSIKMEDVIQKKLNINDDVLKKVNINNHSNDFLDFIENCI